MKKMYLALLASSISLVFYSSCKKSQNLNFPDSGSNVEKQLISNARVAFTNDISNSLPSPTLSNSSENNSNPRMQLKKTPQWDRAYTIIFSGERVVVVPLSYEKKMYLKTNMNNKRVYNIDDVSRLLIYKSRDQKYHEEIITLSPDSNFSNKPNSSFSGILTVEGWAGNFLKEFKFEGSKIKKLDTHFSTQPTPSKTTVDGESTSGTKSDMALVLQVCYTLVEYNYSVDDPSGGVYSYESLGCNTYYIDDGGGSSGGPTGGDYGGVGGGGSVANSLAVIGGKNIIGNIQDYNKCFTNVAGNTHTYQVTVCVDQPKPGTREAWGFSPSGAGGSTFGSNPVDVGHTFLIFTETSGSGTISRNIGFYPQTTVNPFSQSDQGQLNNDASHSYNISLTINISNSQFFNMLNYVALGNNVGFDYNLNSNNCTTFALRTLDAGNVYLPSTLGSWLNGSGNDPGDLGQDIRSMNLSPNMTRNTAEGSHPNLGSCL
jgi:hypothetical protein